MITRSAVRELLAPFGVELSDGQIDNLLQYLSLLLRWNQKINLTSLRTPEECITRHFGESLLLSRLIPLAGRLLDVGSGAGFPGLAIKLLAHDLEVILLEPVAKKRAFLKEVARTCRLSPVRVDASRIQEFSRQCRAGPFDIVTVRAVGGLESVIPASVTLLKQGGWLCLWVGDEQVQEIRGAAQGLRWLDPVPIPTRSRSCILIGRNLSNVHD